MENNSKQSKPQRLWIWLLVPGAILIEGTVVDLSHNDPLKLSPIMSAFSIVPPQRWFQFLLLVLAVLCLLWLRSQIAGPSERSQLFSYRVQTFGATGETKVSLSPGLVVATITIIMIAAAAGSLLLVDPQAGKPAVAGPSSSPTP